MVQRLVQWAQTADEPLRSYSTGLLAGAMEVQDIAANFKDSNAILVSGFHFLVVLHVLRTSVIIFQGERKI